MPKTKTTKQKPDKQVISRNPDGTFPPGVSGNPNGRPKGKTIKELVREYLEEHPDEMNAFVEHFVKNNRELAWQMLEGRPFQDILSGGEKLPTPILNVFNNDIDQKNKGTDEEN